MNRFALDSVHTTPDGEIHEPALGVHVLTEFVFCQRAGLCAFETGPVEPDETLPLSFFAFNPLYSLAEIEAALERRLNELKAFSMAAAGSAIVGVALAVLVNQLVGMSGFVCMAYFLTLAARSGWHAVRLQEQRTFAMTAPGVEPDLLSTERQFIYWWDLLKAGFETQPAHDRLIDNELNFSGRPSRFLRRGNTVIPVWRMPHYDGTLYPQNFVRMAAYCHLVRASFGPGVDCPYGVILFGASFFGVAIPFTNESETELLLALIGARNTIDLSKRRVDPRPPESPAICSSCPFGKPKPYQPFWSVHTCNQKSLPVIAASSPEGKEYHSLCGDRFRWLPLHDDVEKKDLRLQL